MKYFSFKRDDLPGYMERWILTTPWGEVRLHHILTSDYDRDAHDHPFSFISTILWGHYSEAMYHTPPAHLLNQSAILDKIWTPPRWVPRFVTATQLHRLTLLAPVWTLVLAGKRHREWGFQTEKGWVQWEQYCAEQGKEMND